VRTVLITSIGCAFVLLSLIACGGGNKTQSTSMATVDVSLSDPSTCTAPQGPYTHIYVTITDVKASTNAAAGDNDSSFVDLTPDLKNNPQQIDLLGLATNQCFLATLGSKVQLQPGNYQQIRVILLDNNSASKVANNKCGNATNCAVLGADGSVHTLQLSSEAQTGIKIPSGQIAGGQFTIGAGQTKDLNIDFNACASIVVQGNGQYRLKPVLHAGEAAVTSTSINGKILDRATNQPINAGKTVVALEQKDTVTGIDRVVMETVPDSAGNFVFCPVLAGTYDVVIAAVNGSNVAYSAQIITGVQPGAALGTLTLSAQPTPNSTQASITGLITSANPGNTGQVIDLSVSALQQITSGGSNTLVTIPIAQVGATATLSTAANASCPANTDCVTYTLQLPLLNPFVGNFSATGTTFTQAAGNASYTVDALAFIGGNPSCNPSEQKTPSAIAVSAGVPATAANLTFTGCQ